MSPAPTTAPGPRHVAIYPGSFDPITYGHLDVIRRGRRLFDRVVVGVGRHPGKDPLFSLDERVEMARELIAQLEKEEPGQAAVEVEAYFGLTVDFARKVAAANGSTMTGIVLLRGIRNLSDLQSEVQQALTNRQVAGLETAFVVAGQDFAYTSSSLIKQVTALGEDTELAGLKTMVPTMVIDRLREKKIARAAVLERLRHAGGEE
ncbi:MAG: pantetheine-phosphate adenylyltransferase [Phycisphaeraceae bacterium]|nr:pantetheine-phosphate adenylyltransferase [Phycisphaeraceae bacterium]